MTLSVTHAKVTTVPDDPAYDIGSSEWNANHTLSGSTAAQIVFGASDGSLSQSAKLSWDDTAQILTIGQTIANIVSAGYLNLSAANASSGFSAGYVTLNAGSGTAGNISGGNISNTAGNGFGSGTGGAVYLTGGNGGATSFSVGGVASVQGGAGQSGGGIASVVSGLTLGSGPGAELDLLAADGVGVNMDGGNLALFAGCSTGGGVPGRVYISNLNGNYAVANGAGVVTISNLRPAAVATATIAGWLPLLIDGVLSHIPYWQ